MKDRSLATIRKVTITKLINSGIAKDEAYIEADILIEYITGLNKKDLITFPEKEIPENEIEKIRSLLDKRCNERLPIQYITNRAYFMGYEFYVDSNALIPRPETEILVDEVINHIKLLKHEKPGQEISIIDVGTGSGCIACTIAKYTENTKIIASDISDAALNIARHNAERLNVENKIEFFHSDILSQIDKKLDLIVSNPPYIPIKDRENLQIEVSAHEPHLALFANDEKGISFYKELASQSMLKLKPNGYLTVEIGISQSNDISKIMNDAGLRNIKILQDYNGIDRIITAQK